MTPMLLILYSASLVSCVSVAYTFPRLRQRRRDPAMWAYWLTLLTLALTQTAPLPFTYRTIDRLTGVPHLAALLSDGVTLLGGWTLLAYLYYVDTPADRPRRMLYLTAGAVGGALAVMTALFVLTPASTEDSTLRAAMPRYGEVPFIWGYRLAFVAAEGLIAAIALHLVQHYTRYANMTGRLILRDGLRLFEFATWLALGSVLSESLRVTARQFGVPWPVGNPALLTETALFVGIVAVTIGTTMPSWGPRSGLPHLLYWIERYRAYRRLHPLWLALYHATPGIALLRPLSALGELLAGGDLSFRLLRRAIEIQHGSLILRPYQYPQAERYAREACEAAGIPDEEIPFVVKATVIAAALQAKAQDRRGHCTAAPMSLLGGSDWHSEVATLVRVAHHFQYSPVVRATLARLEAEQRTSGTSPSQPSEAA